MTKLLRVISILTVIGLVQVIQSCCVFTGCCDCSNSPLYYPLNTVYIHNLDNSGTYTTTNDSDEMYSAAVSFEVSLTDSTEFYSYPYYANSKSRTINNSSLGFKSAYAWSCDCDFSFIPSETIESFEIVTEYDINEAVKAGDNVTSLFLARCYGYPRNGLYAPLENIISYLNGVENNQASITFSIFLKINVVYPIARFNLNFRLSNGESLTIKTNEISIIG